MISSVIIWRTTYTGSPCAVRAMTESMQSTPTSTDHQVQPTVQPSVVIIDLTFPLVKVSASDPVQSAP